MKENNESKALETEQSNKMIAEFMGVPLKYDEVKKHWRFNVKGFYEVIQNAFVPISCLEYHSSWDWLMPVLEKIEIDFKAWTSIKTFLMCDTTHYECFIKIRKGDDYSYEYEGDWCDTKLQATYIAVVDFIKWYNENIK